MPSYAIRQRDHVYVEGVIDLVYRRQQALRLIGLGLLAAGIAVAVAVDAAAGLAMVLASALVLLLVQPLLLARLRSRRASRLAPHNGHAGGTDVNDLDEGGR